MPADTAGRACTHKTLPDRRQQIQATSLGTADALSADAPGFLAEGTEDALSADAKRMSLTAYIRKTFTDWRHQIQATS